MIVHTRWTPSRKMEAVAAIRRGEFTREAFMAANSVSEEEMGQWERGADRNCLKVSTRGGTAAIKARA